VKKTVFFFIAVSLLIAVSLSAQKKTEVLLKVSKQEGTLRIVFEAEEHCINRIKVTTLPVQIKIDFPDPFNLTAPKDLPFELVPTEKSLVINLKEKSEIRFFRLPSPSRLVFDIRGLDIQTKETSSEKHPASPEKQPVSIISRGFVIDAGHGGYDFGISYGDTSEKDICLNFAKDLSAALSKKGKKVFLIRRVDQYVSLADRINFVNQKSPDVFISFHSSQTQNITIFRSKLEEQSRLETFEPYSLSFKQKKFIAKSKALSDALGKALTDELKAIIVHREMPLPILNSVGAPAVLIELPSPGVVAYDQQMKTKLINSILNGLTAYGQ
jgi:N-acetylmuramoyl-L-alanine amidase